jgi:hypothetical protein
MLDHDIIGKWAKTAVGAADIGILFYSYNPSVAGGADDRPFRDIPIDRILAAGSGEMTKRAARPLHHHVAAGPKRHRVVGIISGRGTTGAELDMGLILVTPSPRSVGSGEPDENKRPATGGLDRERNPWRRRHVLESRFQGHGKFGNVFALGGHGDDVASLLLGETETVRVIALAEYRARKKRDERDKKSRFQ